MAAAAPVAEREADSAWLGITTKFNNAYYLPLGSSSSTQYYGYGSFLDSGSNGMFFLDQPTLIAPNLLHSLVLGERRHMDINPILTDLKAELNRVTQAIAALEILGGAATATATPTAKTAPKQAKKRHLTPAGQRRLPAMMKARWAARRKQSAKPAPKATRGHRTVSAASRKKMAEAQRKRWAARKKTGNASL